MRRRLVILGLVSLGSLCLLLPSSVSQFVIDDKVTPVSTSVSNSTSKHKVTFVNGSATVKTMYVDDGATVSLKDAPYSLYSGTVYVWKNGSTLLNSHPTISSDTVFTMTSSSGYVDSSAHTYNESSTNSGNENDGMFAGDANVSLPDNKVAMNQCVYSGATTTPMYFFKGTTTKNWLKITDGIKYSYSLSGTHAPGDDRFNIVNMKLKSSETANADGRNGGDYWNSYNADTSVALEDPEAYSNGKSSDKTYRDQGLYKFASAKTAIVTSKATNYVVTRIVLTSDVYLSGSVFLEGNIGVGANNVRFLQIHQQGQIVGGYSELDLNGHDLIIGNGGSIRSYGSITDTSSDRSGNLIVESGGKVYTPFTIQDVYHERSIPQAYFSNAAIFQIFRCPYLNCCTRVDYGGSLYGSFYISVSGGSDKYGTTNSNASGDLFLVGSGEDSNSRSPIFDIANPSGCLIRNVSYDSSLLPSENTGITYAKEQMMTQRIKYSFYGATLTVNPLCFSVSISSVSIDINSRKYQFAVPPFFEFYLYDTQATISQEYVFEAGSYLYVSKDSSLALTKATGLSMSKVSYSLITIHSSQSFSSAGGLSFLDNRCSIEEFFTKQSNSDNDYYGVFRKTNGITRPYVFASNSDTFWDLLSAKGSSCDFDGTISFASSSSTDHPYVLGGNINFRDLGMLSTAISNASLSSSAQIHLYTSAFEVGGSNIRLLITESHRTVTNIEGYYSVPLISNGKVVMNTDGYTLNKTSDMTFNKTTRLISSGSSYYGFFYDSYATPDNLYKLDSLSDEDSLSGSWTSVTPNSDHTVTKGGTKYIWYLGAFIPATGSTYSIVKLQAGDCGTATTSGSITNHNPTSFSYNSTTKLWAATI
jgi:hypothetical protein